VGDDEKWRAILHGLQTTFGRQTVMGKQIEDYISKQAGIDLSKVFDEYLRTTMVPTFEYRIDGTTLSYRWTNVVPGFAMPYRVTLAWPELALIHPTEAWQSSPLKLANLSDFKVDLNFYVNVKEVGKP